MSADALLRRASEDAPVLAFLLEAGRLSEEELAARSLLGLPRVRFALDLLVARGEVSEQWDGVARRGAR